MMGCAASCSVGTFPVTWFTGDSPESLRWQAETTGFGKGRNKSFIAGCQKEYTNRKGNENGQLAGHLVIYSHAGKKANYSKFKINPIIKVQDGTKIFAKAFLRCPLGRMPVGENYLLKADNKADPVTHTGQVLLAMRPRLVSLYVDVDGKPQALEALSFQSLIEPREYYKDFEVKPDFPKRALSGSFFTYVVTRVQDEFFFLHFPILTCFEDCHMVDTGAYGKEMVHAFIRLFSSLRPGPHKIDIRVKIFHDHCDFNYFPVNRNMNARGIWFEDLLNSRLGEPHPEPQDLAEMNAPIAEGSFTVDIPTGFASLTVGLLDRKPPRDAYPDDDIESVRKDARIVNMCHFRENYHGLEGIPDVVILTSQKHERRLRDDELGYRYKYEYIECATLWYNLTDKSPNSYGIMVEGCIAMGEVKPRKTYSTWTFHPLIRAGKPVKHAKIPVMNKYIKEAIDKVNAKQEKKQDTKKETKQGSKKTP